MQQEICIRTITQTFNQRLGVRRPSKLYKRLFRSHLKRSRRRVIRYSLLAANASLLVAVVVFVTQQPSSSVNQAILSQPNSAEAASPLDQLSSADIAVHVSRMVQMDVDEVTQVTNQADSESAQLSVSSADNVVVSKPQLVNTTTKSAKDIKTYVAVAGDTIDTLATKFGVTSDSIRGSNGLSGNTVRVGTQLYIPPVNGIVYVVKSGDTPESLAGRFGGNKDAIIADNDAEVSGLRVGTRILIRDGVFRPAGRTATATTNYTYAGFSFGTSAIYGFNGYTRGYCTWYVASRIAVPSNWGNANTWDDRARLSGWTVSGSPRVGAIAQSNAGYAGHVGIVEAVSEDGTMIKYSDMNGLAGYNRVGFSDWVPARQSYQNFIYR